MPRWRYLKQPRGKYHAARTIMFGPRARGDHGPDSNLGLAAALNGRRGHFVEIRLEKTRIAFDVIPDGEKIDSLPPRSIGAGSTGPSTNTQ
jgi:hypothetical protein